MASFLFRFVTVLYCTVCVLLGVAGAAPRGQGHRARGLDGRELACKLQYPDMISTVEADLRQLKLAFSIYRRYDKAIDPMQIHAELSDRLHEELDYLREAGFIAKP